MIPDQQIKRALKFAKPVLVSKFNASKAQGILAVMEANYQKLATEVPSFKSSFNRMTLKIAVDILAFYQALLTELPQSQALESSALFVNNWMDGQFERWLVRKIYANRILHLISRRWWFSNVNLTVPTSQMDGKMNSYRLKATCSMVLMPLAAVPSNFSPKWVSQSWLPSYVVETSTSRNIYRRGSSSNAPK